jgi:hypothetical protein
LTHDGISGQRSRTARTHLDTNASSFMPMEAVNCMCHCTSLQSPSSYSLPNCITHLSSRTGLVPLPRRWHRRTWSLPLHSPSSSPFLVSLRLSEYVSPFFCVRSYLPPPPCGILCLILMRPSPGCRYHYAPPRSPRRSWSTDLVPPSGWMGQR